MSGSSVARNLLKVQSQCTSPRWDVAAGRRQLGQRDSSITSESADGFPEKRLSTEVMVRQPCSPMVTQISRRQIALGYMVLVGDLATSIAHGVGSPGQFNIIEKGSHNWLEFNIGKGLADSGTLMVVVHGP